MFSRRIYVEKCGTKNHMASINSRTMVKQTTSILSHYHSLIVGEWRHRSPQNLGVSGSNDDLLAKNQRHAIICRNGGKH